MIRIEVAANSTGRRIIGAGACCVRNAPAINLGKTGITLAQVAIPSRVTLMRASIAHVAHLYPVANTLQAYLRVALLAHALILIPNGLGNGCAS